jgi:hypothetical protein
MDNLQPEIAKTEPSIAKSHHSHFFGEPHSKIFKIIIVLLFQLILLLGAFSLGLNVGQHKAKYTYAWVKNYPNNFPLPSGKNFVIPPPPESGQYFNAHGVDGTILSLKETSAVIKDDNGTEKTILIQPQTFIKHNFETFTIKNLKIGQQILVLGEANESGQIQAKFIRVLDERQ